MHEHETSWMGYGNNKTCFIAKLSCSRAHTVCSYFQLFLFGLMLYAADFYQGTNYNLNGSVQVTCRFVPHIRVHIFAVFAKRVSSAAVWMKTKGWYLLWHNWSVCTTHNDIRISWTTLNVFCTASDKDGHVLITVPLSVYLHVLPRFSNQANGQIINLLSGVQNSLSNNGFDFLSFELCKTKRSHEHNDVSYTVSPH